MFLSRKSRFAIKAMFHLARFAQHELQKIGDMWR